jgi:hypothetical protein
VTTTTPDKPITFETQANQSEFAEAQRVANATRTVTGIRDGDLWLAIRLLMRPLFGGTPFGRYQSKRDIAQLSRLGMDDRWRSHRTSARSLDPGSTRGNSPSCRTSQRDERSITIRCEQRRNPRNQPATGVRHLLSRIGVGEEDGSRLLPWSAFLGYRETQRLIVLLYKEKASLVIAKRCLSSIAAAGLVSILSQKLRRI